MTRNGSARPFPKEFMSPPIWSSQTGSGRRGFRLRRYPEGIATASHRSAGEHLRHACPVRIQAARSRRRLQRSPATKRKSATARPPKRTAAPAATRRSDRFMRRDPGVCLPAGRRPLRRGVDCLRQREDLVREVEQLFVLLVLLLDGLPLLVRDHLAL